MFGEMMDAVWKSMKGWDLTTAATALVYVAIVALLIVAYLRCIRPVRYCQRKLKTAIRLLKKAPSQQPWQDKNFLGKGLLYPVWCEYLNSRNFADSNYHNASPLEDYINEDSVITEPGRESLSEAVPGLMVSLGFLGTLVGLMMGLSDFNMTDTDTTMAAIRQVVSGMKYAFTTSIVGVLCSISFSLLSRAVHGSARGTLTRFYEVMHKQAGVQAVDPLTQITIYQQEQTSLVQAVAEDITGNLTDRLGNVLEMALQPLQTSLDDFIHVSTKEQIRGVESMVNQFVNQMDRSLSMQTGNLAHTLAETCRWQGETARYVNEIMEGMKTVTADVTRIDQMTQTMILKFDGYLNKLGAAQMQLDQGYSTVASSSRAMESASKRQMECVTQLVDLNNELVREMTQFRSQMAEVGKDASDRIQTQLDALAKTQEEGAQALGKAADELRVNGQILSDAHGVFIKGMNQELDRTFEIFSKDLNGITDSFKTTIAAMEEAVRDVPAMLREGAEACRSDLRRDGGSR